MKQRFVTLLLLSFFFSALFASCTSGKGCDTCDAYNQVDIAVNE